MFVYRNAELGLLTAGLEPACSNEQKLLKLSCLPISPSKLPRILICRYVWGGDIKTATPFWLLRLQPNTGPFSQPRAPISYIEHILI